MMLLREPSRALALCCVVIAIAGCPAIPSDVRDELDFTSLGWKYDLHVWDGGHSIEQTPDGGYFIVGESAPDIQAGSNMQVMCIKLSASGVVQWHRVVEGLYRKAGFGPEAKGVYVPDGGAVLAGLTAYNLGGTAYDGRLRIVRLKSSGETVWDHTYYPDQQWIPQGIARAGDGGFVVLLHEGGMYTSGAERIMKVNGEGAVVWDKAVTSPRTYSGLQDLKETGSGGYLAAGASTPEGDGAGGWDVSLAKTNSDGDLLWWRDYARWGHEEGLAVDIAPDGGYVMAGIVGPEPHAIRTDSNGNLLWARDDIIDVDTSDASAPDYDVWDVAVTPDGCIALVGIAESVTYYNQFLPRIDRGGYILELDPSGNLKWVKHFPGNEVDTIYGVTLNSEGHYVTVGATQTLKAQVLKIDRSGNLLN